MATIDLHYVDELIQARQSQHGGSPGAPPVLGGHRVGTSINRSCIVMLSALLQSYVEEVFQDAARRVFPQFAAHQDGFDAYWRQVKGWGNPSDSNIKTLFLRLGVVDVFSGLSWQHTDERAIKKNLDTLNQLRNQIAHGASRIVVNQASYSLSLAEVTRFRNFSHTFANRFERHVAGFIP
ncbi:hypothetical protein GGQ86_002347 [Xanthobacter flavus]|uniref:RiboL-PSP-HEPN domain-containing protein n=1 Tax=Xanthobacter flavus TaxID=281 RepID=A0ABU1KGB1_XANFL|nr:HEPN domain-containing protein [Xanthobacter flavus]MDR6333877.1 hypothetical protein [Xanthobacter flavus]